MESGGSQDSTFFLALLFLSWLPQVSSGFGPPSGSPHLEAWAL